jgi:tetratricopeptide (TPR) repeat protein
METVNTVAKLEETHSLAGFLQKYRTLLAGLLIAIVGAVAVFFIIAGVSDAAQKKKTAALETLIEQYEKLAAGIDEGADGAEITTLLVDLESFAAKTNGYAGAKAWSLAGTLYAKQKQWGDAERTFAQSAKAGAKTHLYGPGLFNAGVAAEQGGNSDAAIDYYTRSIGAPEMAAAQAQFAVGRLQEAKGDTEAARLAYRRVIEQYTGSADAVWRNLAQTRLIAFDL